MKFLTLNLYIFLNLFSSFCFADQSFPESQIYKDFEEGLSLKKEDRKCEIIQEHSGTIYERDGIGTIVRRTLYFTIQLQNYLDYQTCFPPKHVKDITDLACQNLASTHADIHQVVITLDSPQFPSKGRILLRGHCEDSDQTDLIGDKFIMKRKFVTDSYWKLEIDLSE